ncbi:MAG: efflux RND transporter periplasmic adaptor subunit [Phycisphaerae bacterium]
MSPNESGTSSRRGGIARIAWKVLTKLILPIVVIAVAVLAARKLIQTAPKAPRRQRPRLARLVEVTPARLVGRPVVIEAMGEVHPAHEVELRPQVTGRLEWVNPDLEPGAWFEANAPLMRIEDDDYRILVDQRISEAAMARTSIAEANRRLEYARRDLKLELGSRAVARKEYEALDLEMDPNQAELVLREPQLAAARAEVTAARAAVESAQASHRAALLRLKDARLDLARTTLSAPFPVVVRQKLADRGDTVSGSTPVLRLIGSREFWVELAVPQSDLKWLRMPGLDAGGSTVKLQMETIWPEGVFRTGRVIRRLPGVDPQGRMARVLVSVTDPLSLDDANDSPPLLVGNYVRAEITGRDVESAVVLPRPLLRNGDQVWVMNDADRLEIRTVTMLYRGREDVLVSGGLEPGERVVTTDLGAPVEGMKLRLNGPSPTTRQAEDGPRREARP